MADETTAVAGAGGTSTVASTAGQPVFDWEVSANPFVAKFKGLQGKHQQVTEEAKTLKAQLDEFMGKHTSLTGEHEALKLQLGALREQAEMTTTEKETVAAGLERVKLIAREFPDLLGLELDDLLPDGAGDELKTKLTAFKAALDKRGQATVKTVLNGATTPAPNPDPTSSATPSDLLRAAHLALQEGKTDQYNAIMDKYYLTPQPKS